MHNLELKELFAFQNVHKHCLQVFLEITMVPRENKKQCLFKVLEGKQRVLWYFESGQIRKSCHMTLGSSRNHDGYGDENITSKYTFELFQVFHAYSILFIVYNMGKVS